MCLERAIKVLLILHVLFADAFAESVILWRFARGGNAEIAKNVREEVKVCLFFVHARHAKVAASRAAKAAAPCVCILGSIHVPRNPT